MGKGKRPQTRLRHTSITKQKAVEIINRIRDALQPPSPSPANAQLEALAAATRAHEMTTTLNPDHLGLESAIEQPPTTNPLANLPPENAQLWLSQSMETLLDSPNVDSDPTPTSKSVTRHVREQAPSSELPDARKSPRPDRGRYLVKTNGLQINVFPPSEGSDTSSSSIATKGNDAGRYSDRPLTWNELWQAWPTLTAQEIKSIRQGDMPVQTIAWSYAPPRSEDDTDDSDHFNLYGYFTTVDAPLSIHPPQRTSSHLMSPWQIAKLWVTRGMHLQIVVEIYKLRFGDEHRRKLDGIMDFVRSVKEHQIEQRLQFVRRTLAAGKEKKAKEDFVQTLGQYANAILWTLPWFDEAGPFCPDINTLIVLRGQCFAMIARAVGLHCWQPTPLIPMASIGWDAIKAVLWNAQRYPTSIVKATCDAAGLVNDSLPISRHSKPREQHAAFFTEQANLLKQATCEMFVDVPDHLRSPFFRFNMWNEHHEGC